MIRKRIAISPRSGKRERFRLLPALVILAALMWAAMATGAQARLEKDLPSSKDRAPALGKMAVTIPNTQNRSHRVGSVWMTITNWGTFGSRFGSSQLVERDGPFAGQLAPSFEFPGGSGANYLYQGALWFGAIIGKDTLVSTGTDGWSGINELFPDAGVEGNIIERSNRQSSEHFSYDAVSEQDYIAVYTDTLTDQTFVAADPISGQHRPVGLQITQRSYSWSYDYARDFVLIDFILTNISDQPITQPYMGVFVDADIFHELTGGARGANDDYSGYLISVPSAYSGLRDTVNIAWSADNDGDPGLGGAWDYRSVTGIFGTRVVRSPAAKGGCNPIPLRYSFNWWVSNSDTRFDWGPQRNPGDRNPSGGFGTPEGDPMKYRFLSNGEFDYDQLFAAVDFSAQGWQRPPIMASDIADGFDTRYLFSFGPLEEMAPGESTFVTVACVAGDNFHVGPDDFKRFFRPDRPDQLYKKFDFTSFARNAQWAAWVLDNPGVDTDGDGCRGLYAFGNCRETTIVDIPVDPEHPFGGKDTILANCDTVWYAGDGVPDFKGPPPPPSPPIQVSASPGQIVVRWKGDSTETKIDPFTFRRDFEGYRVYLGESNSLPSFALIASWDVVDYKRYYFDPTLGEWLQTVDPLLLETLYRMYGEDTFDPRNYPSRSHPFVDPHDSLFYFVPQDWNRGNEYLDNGRVVVNPIQFTGTDSTWDDVRKIWVFFGKYECTINNLLPSQPYFIAVTAFDYGNREILAPLESSPLANSTPVYATYSSERAIQEGRSVMVYPNPYKLSDDYRGRGFEDRERRMWSERSRRIHFVNLPERATIKIFSLDGDLIREIHHPDPRFSDTPWHCAWDLITRNTQAAVSGIYFYSIESEYGTQIGKLVIIK